MTAPEPIGALTRPTRAPITDPAQVQADQLLQRATTLFGAVDTAQLRAGVQELARADPALAHASRQLIEQQLSPTDLGSFLGDIWDKAKDIAERIGETITNRPPEGTPATQLATPPTAADAPDQVRFSPQLQTQFEGLWNGSFPGGNALEQGGTLVYDRGTGEMRLINIGGNGATAGSFSPDTSIGNPLTTGLLGVFHTHPYDSGATGISFSGADAAYMINNGQNVVLAQSGDRQFMLMRTSETPDNVDYTQVNNDQNARIAELMGNGATFEGAASQAAQELAARFDLAYYEGQDGTLNRVTP